MGGFLVTSSGTSYALDQDSMPLVSAKSEQLLTAVLGQVYHPETSTVSVPEGNSQILAILLQVFALEEFRLDFEARHELLRNLCEMGICGLKVILAFEHCERSPQNFSEKILWRSPALAAQIATSEILDTSLNWQRTNSN